MIKRSMHKYVWFPLCPKSIYMPHFTLIYNKKKDPKYADTVVTSRITFVKESERASTGCLYGWYCSCSDLKAVVKSGEIVILTPPSALDFTLSVFLVIRAAVFVNHFVRLSSNCLSQKLSWVGEIVISTPTSTSDFTLSIILVINVAVSVNHFVRP